MIIFKPTHGNSPAYGNPFRQETAARGRQSNNRSSRNRALRNKANRTPQTIATDAAAAHSPARTQTPSHSRTARANRQIAMAGGILPMGMGRNRMIDSSRQITPIRYSNGGRASISILGRSRRSARASHGAIRRTTAAKWIRSMDRLPITAGSQGFLPKANWAVRNNSGAPNTEEIPGGMGMMLGKANTNISAPMARSLRATSRSCTEIRVRASSSAIRAKISDRDGPIFPSLGRVGTRMPSSGKRADDLSLAANPENPPAFGQQHGMPRGLAQVNDGLQRQRGGRHGESGLQAAEVGIASDVTERVGDAVKMQTQNLVRGIQRQPVAPPAVQPHAAAVAGHRRPALHDHAAGQHGQRIHVAHEFRHVFIRGRQYDVFGGAGLNDAAVLQYGNVVSEPQRLIQIVADEQDGLLDPILQRQQFALQLAADQRVQRGKRLIHQQNVRVRRKRARQADALLHTAGQFADIAFGPLRQADQFHFLNDDGC